jgi:lipopolysaccharide/colanic/teichoic acid biosynthesis glycosyltransferase
MRLLDISVSLLGLVLVSPLLLVIAVAVKCTSAGPVLYRARRVGKDGRLFHLYKFRSMVADGGTGPRITSSGDTRVTAVGRLLRKTKLDELPQLFNTLIGDMSLVGPRPEDPEYVRLYSVEQRRVLSVKPGITSMATVLHRHEEQMLTGPDSEETYRREILPAKLRIELEYLTHRTWSSDMLILMQTASALFTKPADFGGNRGPQCRS